MFTLFAERFATGDVSSQLRGALCPSKRSMPPVAPSEVGNAQRVRSQAWWLSRLCRWTSHRDPQLSAYAEAARAGIAAGPLF